MRLRNGVDALPRSGRNVGRCPFWNPDLQRIRSDLNRMRRIKRRLPVTSDNYNVIRRVYRAMLLRSRQELFGTRLKRPEILLSSDWPDSGNRDGHFLL